MTAKIVELGTLYVGGQPVEPGALYNGKGLSFGDTCPGMELQWVDDCGLLVSDRTICTNITWEQLDQKGLVFGAPVQIDGKSYLCRCLKVGSKEGIPNEWDALLDKYGENDDLWHWEYQRFWGQETISRPDLPHPIRGGVLARFWCWDKATYQSVDLGFRPALEYLGSEPCPPDTLVGKKAKAYCSDGVTIEGYLVSFSDYDVMLDVSSLAPPSCSRAIREGHNIIVDRENIIWLKEIQV